jgi:hypothetical protein
MYLEAKGGRRCATTAQLTELPSANTAVIRESSMSLGVDASVRDAVAKNRGMIQWKRRNSERDARDHRAAGTDD